MNDAIYNTLTTGQQREVDRLALEYEAAKYYDTAAECRAAAIKLILDRAKQHQQKAAEQNNREFDLF